MRAYTRTVLVFFLLCSFPWLSGQDIGLLVSPGKLSKVHAQYAGVENCKACHTAGKKTDTAKCLQCHKDLAARINAGRGYHKDKKEECIACHPEHHGEDFQLIEFDKKDFDHNETGYPLTGLHKPVTDCLRCHKPPNSLPRKLTVCYLLKDTRCIACHPDVHNGQLGEACDKCHQVETRFQQAKSTFDHNKTAFPLKGGHTRVDCGKCHKRQQGKQGKQQKQWKGLRFKRCAHCHADPHKPSFKPACSRCHNETSWLEVSAFDHRQTRYPLEGKHRGLTCAKCHPPGQKNKKIPFGKCTDCHRRDPHRGQFDKDCGACHTLQGFKKVTLNHDTTRYPLTGKHRSVTCRKCHTPRDNDKIVIYKPLETACAGCHKDIHLGQFQRNCESCHITEGFKQPYLNFDHNAHSSYPLQGKHATVTCGKCHTKTRDTFPAGPGETIRYRPQSRKCGDCHDDFHRGQLSGSCETCHQDFNSFKQVKAFDHRRTRFALDAMHGNVPCAKCHPRITVTAAGEKFETIKFKPIRAQCMDCHRDYNHSAAAFPLTGSHVGLNCRRCHNARTPHTRRTRTAPAGLFQCRHCHRSPHPGDQPLCAQCHTTRSWQVDSWR